MHIKRKTKVALSWALIIIVIVGGFAWYAISMKDSAVTNAIERAIRDTGAQADSGVTVEAFATCLADSGAVMYGAWWCPHCKDQKAMFGEDAEKKLAYVECTENPQQCLDAKIESYPTWIFADGSRQSGTLQFAQLSERTSCPVPTQLR